MPSSTVENYVKQIYLAQQQVRPDELVSLGKLALAMNVVPGTATTMVKALADSGLVHYESRTGVRLSPGGEKLALHVLRRHRLMELFLVQVLGMDWAEVHEEAELLEHAISEKVLEQIDRMLGHPTTDPHGDPIPTPTGELAEPVLHALSSSHPGESLKIARIVDQDPRFLRFANDNGLTPGATLLVEDHNAMADSISLRIADGTKPLVIGMTAARRILVTSIS